MTTAKLVVSPAEGHGLTDRITDPTYHALVTGQKTETIVAVVVLEAVGTGQRKTKQGTHRHVQYEAVRLEPVGDANQANELRYLVQALYEQRTSTGEQKTLPLALGGDREKQLALIERIEDWSASEGLTGGELDARWREEFGIGPDQDWSLGDHGIPGDYRKAGYPFLLEFAGKVGAVSTGDKAAADDADLDDEDDDEDPDLSFTCEVCRNGTASLTDGLCDGCARNAGVPVLADEVGVGT